MIRLRFVREYRGKRIVIDGKLYGVEDELVTDCRYVTAQGHATPSIRSHASRSDESPSRCAST